MQKEMNPIQVKDNCYKTLDYMQNALEMDDQETLRVLKRCVRVCNEVMKKK